MTRTAVAGFEGFYPRRVFAGRGMINAMIGGEGPPILLLHGYPESLIMWRTVAVRLARTFTVVVPDLPGYGESFVPVAQADHWPSDKRMIANDLIQAMSSLGFSRFSVAGHDRGGRVAYRMALDHPDRVDSVAVLDIVPTAEVYRLPGVLFARYYAHWAFLAQPAPLPENLIAANPSAFFNLQAGMALGSKSARYPAEVLQRYRDAFDRRDAVEAMCEDYRAGATRDLEYDEHDSSTRVKITRPLLVLWSTKGSLPHVFPDVLGVWRRWATDVRGRPVEAGHFLVEDQPEETARELSKFFSLRTTSVGA